MNKRADFEYRIQNWIFPRENSGLRWPYRDEKAPKQMGEYAYSNRMVGNRAMHGDPEREGDGVEITTWNVASLSPISPLKPYSPSPEKGSPKPLSALPIPGNGPEITLSGPGRTGNGQSGPARQHERRVRAGPLLLEEFHHCFMVYCIILYHTI